MKNSRSKPSILLALALTVPAAAMAVAQERGRFQGAIIAEWKDDGRKMELKVPLLYVDYDGRKWRVPAGTVVDGATIPQVFWSVIGGPFEGRYRNASVIHDYYCDIKTRRYEDVHRVFYNAMLSSGVEKVRAWLMYKAVEKFGPQWEAPKVDPNCVRPDGKFDFDKCTENTVRRKIPTRWPRTHKEDVVKFVDEMKGIADPKDLEAIIKAVAR